MKNVLSLSVFVPFLFSSALAANVCIQKVQFAVSPQGVCEAFSSPCVVPAGWKEIDSCELVEIESGAGVQDVLSRREFGRNRVALQKKAQYLQTRQQAAFEKTSVRSFGVGAFMKDAEYQKRQQKELVKDFDKRGFRSVPNYSNNASFEMFKELNKNLVGGLNRKNSSEVKETPISSVPRLTSDVKRTGPLKNYNRTNERTFSDVKAGERNPFWTDALEKQQRELQEKKKVNKEVLLKRRMEKSTDPAYRGTNMRRQFGIDYDFLLKKKSEDALNK